MAKTKVHNLSAKQKAFCEEYVIDHNGTQAAIRAEYSEKSSRAQACKLLTKDNIKKYVEELEQIEKSKRIAKKDEVLEFLTSMMRGEIEEEVVVIEGTGKGLSEASKMKKEAQLKDRLSATKELGKRYQIADDTNNLDALKKLDQLLGNLDSQATDYEEDDDEDEDD
jgi:phage terminase small subunit